jgi:hypothetical protein
VKKNKAVLDGEEKRSGGQDRTAGWSTRKQTGKTGKRGRTQEGTRERRARIDREEED